MPVYYLLKYSSNYSETMRSLWFCSKDKVANFINNITSTNNFESFKHKDKLLGNAVAQPALNAANVILRNVAITVPLIYLRNFWRSL